MTKFDKLGDPHMGRSFMAGVPLARRGERELLMWSQFESRVMNPTEKIHVCVGDLFDKAFMPYNVIMRVARIYIAAAIRNPTVMFIILKGNHDWMRDLTAYSAFDVFKELVIGYKNIKIVDDVMVMDKTIFIAWHPTRDVRKLLNSMADPLEVAFTHCDIMDIADGNLNLLPSKELAAIGVKTVYNGHIHHPKTFDRDGLTVVGVGSMQPYAHGEEVDNSLYITLTLQELEVTNLNLKNRCVRVLLTSGQTLEQTVDCLQLVVKRLGNNDDVVVDVSLGDFDVDQLFTKSLEDAGVSTAISAKLVDEYNRKRVSNAVPNS